MYFHYLYFNAVKWSYLQGMVIVPYLALAPTIVTGAITLGFVQQITRAFGRVEGSLQYLVKSWSTIVELISVWKRLREFENRLEKNTSLEEIKHGNAQIIIGTHALLNKSVKYNDLGLLIIDEEHKFGVKHKEIIKGIKEDIDVLSLTATPIPRTLNSALSEIKDMSIINTPPVGRKNIVTNIIEKSDTLIGQYIDREINRGGQVLFVHNNIDTMDEEINFIKKINNKYKIEKVHGRLTNKEIEMIMSNFINEKIDILICTSIVESGLDMANVNTCLLYTSPSPRDLSTSRMPSSA